MRGLVLILLLMGCQPDDDVQRFIDRVESMPLPQWQPPPALSQLQMVEYQPGPHNPFHYYRSGDLQLTEEDLDCPFKAPELADSNLQQVALSSLVMRGSIGAGEQLWALVEGDDGNIHRVAVGDRIGQDNGLVDAVTKEAVSLTEWVDLGGRCLQPRQALLKLAQAEGRLQ